MLALGMLLGVGHAVFVVEVVEDSEVAAKVQRWYATGSGVMFGQC